MAGYVLWLQNAAYPARYDRQLIAEVFGFRERIMRGLVVTQNGGGDFSVNVSAGSTVIIGEDQPNQGMGLAIFEAAENVLMPPPPGSNLRLDAICVQMNDPQAGGPAGDNATFIVEEGATAPSNPALPAIPPSAIMIAQVLRTAGEGAVLTPAITNNGPRGTFPYTVGTGAVPATLPPGDIYIRVT